MKEYVATSWNVNLRRDSKDLIAVQRPAGDGWRLVTSCCFAGGEIVWTWERETPVAPGAPAAPAPQKGVKK